MSSEIRNHDKTINLYLCTFTGFQNSISITMKKFFITFLIFCLAFTFKTNVYGQQINFPSAKKAWMHHETPSDAYQNNSNQNSKSSPAYKIRSYNFYATQVNINGFGGNIPNDAANEPSIAINPVNPLEMVIGWRQFDNINNNFRQAGYGYTQDGGETWTFPGVINPGVFRSDPVLGCNSDGTFFYNSLTVDAQGNYRCDVYKNVDGGFTWDNGTIAQGGDKQWMVIDQSGGIGDGNIYSFWTSFYSYCYPGNFTRSVNDGLNYEDCSPVDGDPSWGTMAVGPDGELYVAGAGYSGLVVAKSSNAQNPVSNVSWDFSTQVDLDGELTGWTNVNPEGLLGQAYISVDNSDGPGRGNVYVLASVQRNSNGDPGDVMFSRSTDGGITFDAPIRINGDLGFSNYQWFGTMSVATNGRIDAVWLDTRNDPGTVMSSLYYSYSLDQGITWSPNERLSDSFDPHLGWPNQNKMGDYFHMVSDNYNAHLAWAATFNGEQDVYYGRITPLDPTRVTSQEATHFTQLNSSPNPFSFQTTFNYHIPESCLVNLTIYDIYGKPVQVLANEIQTSGTHSIDYIPEKLSNGMYYCKLTTGTSVTTSQIMYLK